MTIDFSTGFYFHREGEGLLMGMADPNETPGFKLDATDDWIPALLEVAERRAPVITEAGIAGGWAGLYEVSPDHNAIVGEAATPARFLYATGFSGHGFLQGPAVGEIVRDLYLGREPFVDVSPLSADRFARPRHAPREERRVTEMIDAAGLRRRLSMLAAIDALETALRGPARRRPRPERTVVEVGSGSMLLMPATGSEGAAGVKLVTLQPDNPGRGLPLVHGVYVLFRAGTLEPAAVIDGGELTAIRTAAVSGLATRHLARPEASRLVVFGAGVQARAHVEAMLAVRTITHITVVGRSQEPRPPTWWSTCAAPVSMPRSAMPVRWPAPTSCAAAPHPGEPLFDGALLQPGCHVNAIGSYQPHTREIDTATVTGSRFVVDDVDAVLAEAGDVQIPIAEGAFSAESIAGDLQSVVAGRSVRQGPADITVFKSVGVAWQDLIIAAAVLVNNGAWHRYSPLSFRWRPGGGRRR